MHRTLLRPLRSVCFGLLLINLIPSSPLASSTRACVQEVSSPERDTQSAAIASIAAGDFEKARALLDDLLLKDYLKRAAEISGLGDPALALTLIDRALDLAPKHTPTLLAKAETSLFLAQQGIQQGAPSFLITGAMQDALDHFKKASKDDQGATFGAVRSASMLGATREALEWARAGRQILFQGGPASRPLKDLSPLPERSLAEAFYRAYTESKLAVRAAEAELSPEQEGAQIDPQLLATAKLLFVECEDALGDLLGRASNDPWVWSTLSDLYVWDSRFELAMQRLEQGIKRLPGDPGLLSRLSDVAPGALGRDASVKLFEEVCAANPGDTLSFFYLGLQRFELGLELFSAGDYQAALFNTAEADFRRSRELFEGNTELCIAYELVARCARGWCAYYGDENLELAAQLFHSMNELKAGGISYALGVRLRSGIDGLAFIGDSYRQRADNLRAAESFEAAHHAEPTNGNWANNAGFFLRDAAVEIERLGKRLCAAARGEVQDPDLLAGLRAEVGIDADQIPADEAQILHAAALQRLEQARDLIGRSWLAYERAAAIQPDDVRIVNDAALVLVYYDHHLLEVAEELLIRATELGLVQVPAMRAEIDAAELDESELASRETELRDLTEALGDAYQNLGVLEWVHRGNSDRALAYLERSVEIGPDPRPDLSNNLMPIVRGERESTAGNYFDLKDWGHPCIRD